MSGPAGAPAGATEQDLQSILAERDRPPGGDEAAVETGGGMLRSTIQTYGSMIGVAVLSLANAIVTARALGVSGRGELAFLTTVGFLGSAVWTLGVQEANVNLAGSEPASRRALATNSLVLSVLLGVLAALSITALVLAVPAARAGVSTTLFALMLAAMPMLILNVYLRFLIQGDRGFGVTGFAWFLPAVINITVNGSLAAMGELQVWIAVTAWIAGQAIGTLILVWYVQRRGAGFGRADAGLVRRTLGFGVKSHFGRIMLVANYRLDQWLLGAIAGTKALGQYSVAVAWAESLFLLPTALSAVQRPEVVRATPKEAVAITARIFRLSMLVTAVCAVALLILAPFLCVTIFGEEFRDSVADLRVLACGAFGVVALKQLGNALTGRNRPIAASLSIGSAFVFTLALDVALIPGYEDLGAAIASSVAYTLGGIVIAVVFARTLGGKVRDLVPRRGDVAALVELLREARRRVSA